MTEPRAFNIPLRRDHSVPGEVYDSRVENCPVMIKVSRYGDVYQCLIFAAEGNPPILCRYGSSVEEAVSSVERLAKELQSALAYLLGQER